MYKLFNNKSVSVLLQFDCRVVTTHEEEEVEEEEQEKVEIIDIEKAQCVAIENMFGGPFCFYLLFTPLSRHLHLCIIHSHVSATLISTALS